MGRQIVLSSSIYDDYAQYRPAHILPVRWHNARSRKTAGAAPSHFTLMQGGVNVMPKIRPVGDRVVVQAAAREETTKSGIVIPDTAKEKPQEGTIIAIGSGRLLDNGERAPMEVHEGDRVLFAKYGGTEFKLDNEEYLVLKESDVLAIIG